MFFKWKESMILLLLIFFTRDTISIRLKKRKKDKNQHCLFLPTSQQRININKTQFMNVIFFFKVTLFN